MRRALANRPFAMLLSGFVLWSVAFVVLYGIQALGCRLAWDGVALAGPLGLHRALLAAIFLAFLAAHGALYAGLRGVRSGPAGKGETAHAFAARVAAHLGLVALGAAVFTFAGVTWLSTC